MAEMEMSWFILQWGLTTSEKMEAIKQEVADITEETKAKKS